MSALKHIQLNDCLFYPKEVMKYRASQVNSIMLDENFDILVNVLNNFHANAYKGISILCSWFACNWEAN